MRILHSELADYPQLDIFSGDPVLPTPAEKIQAARDRRDLGMSRSQGRADRVLGNWSGQALHCLTVFLAEQGSKEFLAEEFVEFAKLAGLDAPPDGRAYGSVVRSAALRGLIVKTGYRLALTSNHSPKCLWRGVVRYPPIEEVLGEPLDSVAEPARGSEDPTCASAELDEV